MYTVYSCVLLIEQHCKINSNPQILTDLEVQNVSHWSLETFVDIFHCRIADQCINIYMFFYDY